MGVTLLGVKAGEIKRDKDHFAVTIIDHPGLRTTTYRNPFPGPVLLTHIYKMMMLLLALI